jgi:formylglycine-generating enzyme required for sulfatase activity
MSDTIFICYRRGDAAVAGRLYDRLEHTFGPQRLFMDVDNIAPGEDFVAVLKTQVAACDVLLALIGRGWLTATDKTGRRRLDNPDDFVRIEIASGLAQGKRVIPVLVDDTAMPTANELPGELMPLARRQAVRIVHDRFKEDAERLARVLDKALAEAEVRRKAEEERQRAEALRVAEEQERREAAQLERKAEEKHRRAEARRKAEEERQRAEIQRKAEEKQRQAEARRKAEEERQRAEIQRKAEEKQRQAEARRKAVVAKLRSLSRLLSDKLRSLNKLLSDVVAKLRGSGRLLLDKLRSSGRPVLVVVAVVCLIGIALRYSSPVQYIVGVMYEGGRGVAKDDEQAVFWYRKAAEQGNADAQYSVGWMYENGRGVANDDAQAVFWYRKAAEQGNADAQYNLGWMYENGRGVAKDDEQAVVWYRKAAEQGNALARNNLGVMYAEGRGVANDDEQAVDWYRKAAEQGNADAQHNLGLMYENGRGVARDDAQAVSWYRKAAERSNEDAKYKLGLIAKNRATFEVFKECDVCPEMVALPGGTFTMGSPRNERYRTNHEGPQRQVTIKPFDIGKHEVTFAEWGACVADGGCNEPSDSGAEGRDSQPVVNVSWQDAQAYVSWLSKKTGKRYRLPTEAEWEYAARAGTTTPFSFGKTISTAQANYDGRYTYGPRGSKGEYRERTVPVGSLPANPWGLHEVHGNVWELVEDCWHESYQGAPQDGRAWVEASCTERVLRGGSLNNRPQDLRSAIRISVGPDFRNYDLGFRVARTLSP